MSRFFFMLEGMFIYELNNIEVWVYLGITPEEQGSKQKVLISLAFEFDGSKAAKSDDIKETQDYFLIQQHIKNFPKENTYALLEKLHKDLSESLNTLFPEIVIKNLSLEKFPFEDGSITIKTP